MSIFFDRNKVLKHGNQYISNAMYYNRCIINEMCYSRCINNVMSYNRFINNYVLIECIKSIWYLLIIITFSKLIYFKSKVLVTIISSELNIFVFNIYILHKFCRGKQCLWYSSDQYIKNILYFKDFALSVVCIWK